MTHHRLYNFRFPPSPPCGLPCGTS